MEKNKFISDKISKLMSEGKTREQSISIAYSMYEKLPKGQQGGANFYQGMFGQPQYTPPSELGFNQGQQYMGFGYDPNYVNQLSPESLKAGETFAQNNPLPQGVIPNEIGYESNIKYKEPTNNQTNYNNIYNDKILNPYGGLDLESTLAWTGQQFGQGNVGKGVAGSALGLLKGARTFMSGLGAGTENQRVQDEYYNNLKNPNYNYQMLQEGAIVAPQPIPTTINELISQGTKEVNSNYRPIRKIQKGVTGGKGESGAYYYYDKLPGEPGFDPKIHRDFVTEQSMSEQRFRNITPELYNPELQKYEQSLGIRQEGGKVTNGDMMTGQFITDMPQNPNVIIEDKEFVKNSETGAVQKAVGDTHMDDSKGIPVNLPEGSKVMSNYTKIGAENAKMFKENFDIKVSSKDTFADVMDKVNKKIGVEKLVKEEKEYLTSIEKQTKSSIDKTTKKVNLKFLADELKEIEEKKQELQQKQNEAFEIIFERQERITKKGDGKTILDENGQPMMQEGGMTQESDIVSEVASMLQQGVSPEEIVNMLIQQGVSQEEAVQLIQAIIQEQSPQEVPMAQEGGSIDYTKEPTDKSRKAQQDRLRAFQEDMKKLGFRGEIDLNAKDLGKEAGKMQEFLKASYPELTKHYAADTKLTAKGIDNLKATLPEAFSEMDINPNKKSTDYTAEETNSLLRFAEESGKLNEDFLIDSNFVDYKWDWRRPFTREREFTNQEEYDAYMKDKGESFNEFFPLGEGIYERPSLKLQPELAPATTPEPAKDVNINMPQPTTQTREVDRYSMINMPVDFILPPSSLQPVAKQSVQLGRLDPVKVSVEPNIQTAESQRTQATNALSFLPDSQRASAIAQMLGQTQQATNQAISQAEMANASSQMQADQINMGQADKEQIMNKNFDAQYQNQMMTAITNTDRDIRQYFNALNDQQAYKFNYVERRNLANQMFDNYSVGSDGVNFKGGTPIVAQRDAQLDYLNQAYLNAKTPEEKNKLQQALQAHYAKKA